MEDDDPDDDSHETSFASWLLLGMKTAGEHPLRACDRTGPGASIANNRDLMRLLHMN